MKKNLNVVNELNELLFLAAKNYKSTSLDNFSKNFKKISSVEEYSQIPVTKKEDFYNFNSKNKFAYLKRSRADENGKEPILPLTKNDYWRYVESETSRFRAMGVRETDRISVVNFTVNETIPIVNSLIELGVTYVVTEGEIDSICEDLVKKKVNVIFTYYRMLENILEHVEEHKLSLKLRLVIVTAEPIGDVKTIRQRTKNILGAKIIDTIGTREIGGYAYECTRGKNYYHFLDNLYVETIDQSSKKITKGVGELLITPLWRKDLPLIRFATSDLIKLEKKTCSCAVKNDLVFKKILGRLNDNVKISSSMIDLRAVYFEVKKVIHQQYPLIDRVLWRFFQEINFSIVLGREKEVDVLIIFIDKGMFNQFFRKKRTIIDHFSSKFKIGVELILLQNQLMLSLPKERYLDIRYSRAKLSKKLLLILKKNLVSFDL